MGTRSLTLVYDDVLDGEYDKSKTPEQQKVKQVPIINMYRQFDGYISGHGQELADFLKPITIINGISDDNAIAANGMGCLAAQLVAHFKIEHGRGKNHLGSIYLHPVDNRDCWQEYVYHVYENKVEVFEEYTSKTKPIFSGTWEEFHTFCHSPEKEVND